MKKFALAMLLAAVLFATASPVRAQYYSSQDALNLLKGKVDSAYTLIDSLTALLSAPHPVTVSEHSLFTGLTMRSAVAGSATNLKSGYRTFPVTAGPDLHGAKAAYLVIDYNDFQHGGFTIQHRFSASATDTVFNYYDGSAWSAVDTISVSDSLGSLAGMIAEDVAGSLVFRIPDIPGAGYYFVKLTPWGTAHGNNIYNIAGTLVVVW